jgi:hypothetical protein
MVIEGSDLLAGELRPLAEEGLKMTWGVTDLAAAISNENLRREYRNRRWKLHSDSRNWSLSDIQETIDNLWWTRAPEAQKKRHASAPNSTKLL